jgi:RNA polymerase sigma factor (sigma-70 family)
MSPKISIRLLAAQSDQRLAALAAAGHERAFETLVHRYRRPLLRYCRRIGLNDARAEDVMQQAFLRAWLAFARQTDVRDVRPWLYRIVHNTAVNAMRGAGEHHSELTEAIQTAVSVTRESELQRRIAVRDALTDVAALPQMQQQAIFLTAVHGQSHEEVATVLGVSEGAVRGLLYRARATLRSAAAALVPPQLVEWAARGGGAGGAGAERLAELSAGGGAAGMTGLIAKGAVVAVTAGAIAAGGAVVSSPGPDATARAPRAASGAGAPASSRLVAGTSKPATVSTSTVALVQRAQSANASSHRRSGGGSSTHDDRSSASGGDRHRGSRGDDGAQRGPVHDGMVRDLSRAEGRDGGAHGAGGRSSSTGGGARSGSGDSGASGGGSPDTTMLTAAADPRRSTSSHDGASTTDGRPGAALAPASSSGSSGDGSGGGGPATSIANPGSGPGSDG